MTSKTRNQAFILLAITLISLIALAPTFAPSVMGPGFAMPKWWPTQKIKLGLDLRGGTYLVLGVQTEEAVKSQLVTISSAIKADSNPKNLGVKRAKASGDRGVQIQLFDQNKEADVDAYIRQNFPDLQKVDAIKQGERELVVNYKISELKSQEVERNAVDQAIETVRNRVDQFGVAEPQIQRSGEKRLIVQLPDITDIDSVKKTIGSVAKLEFRLVGDPARPEASTVPVRFRGGETLQLEDEVVMSGDSIQSASIELNPRTNEIEVLLHLNSIGSQVFERVTGENVNRRLAIVLDGMGQSAPVIRDRISGGTAQITGGFTTEEAHRLAIVLRSGALPAPLTFEEQRTVGASLGADSIHKGIVASLIGAALVVVFMIGYYKKTGVLAIGCLMLNIIWLLAMLAMFGSTLTLPGIAGLALTVGMAVDANIIIYERIRDELRAGVTSKAAIEAGFDRAHWTILDANMTTLLSGLVLYGFGTGPIKGFAVTLCIGIVTTVAAALFASHLGFRVFKMKNAKGELSI